jgi:hypothetical protein
MERYMAKGEEQLKKDIKLMREMLDQRTGSIKSLDGMKIRYNVFTKFLPKENKTGTSKSGNTETGGPDTSL